MVAAFPRDVHPSIGLPKRESLLSFLTATQKFVQVHKTNLASWLNVAFSKQCEGKWFLRKCACMLKRVPFPSPSCGGDKGKWFLSFARLLQEIRDSSKFSCKLSPGFCKCHPASARGIFHSPDSISSFLQMGEDNSKAEIHGAWAEVPDPDW